MKTTRAAFKNSILPKSVKGGEEIEVLVSPIGTFPHPDGEQLCTREAFDALVEKWRADGEPEILVDFDHASETGGATEAAAWATALRSDEDGLHATFRMTDKGAEALSATRYRYLSPAWYVDEEGHPTELSTIALTNRPNLPVPRLLNRRPDGPSCPPSVATQNAEAGESHLPDPAGAGEGNPPEEGNTTEPQKNDMDKLREMLGLAAEATDEEVLAAVDALRAERDQLRSEKEQMEAAAKEAALDAEADKFVEEQGDKIADRDACKNAYKRDPEGTRALFNAIRIPAKPAEPVDGKTARVVDVNAAKKPADSDLLANCKNGKERMAWALAHAADKVD
jgi:phage I-like protein